MPGARTLITVAPTGAEVSKSALLPVTLDELVAAAQECEAAGAAVVHVHIRDDDALPSLDLTRLRDTVQALRQETDLVVQLSTGGAVTDPYEHRLRVLDAAPDSCSLTCGTVNFGDAVFLNPWPFVVELYEETQRRGVVPEFELFDLGHGDPASALDACGPPAGGHVHCDHHGCARRHAGYGARARVGGDGVAGGRQRQLGSDGIGRSSLPVMLAALSAGGHLRVGMEDITRGRPVRHNTELVERAARLATLAQRAPMSARRRAPSSAYSDDADHCRGGAFRFRRRASSRIGGRPRRGWSDCPRSGTSTHRFIRVRPTSRCKLRACCAWAYGCPLSCSHCRLEP